jgi:quercetin dioxygenase-like cupin family protein
MTFLDHAAQPNEDWRPGVVTRMRVAASNGARQLCQFEQWCDPGCGAPTHVHAVEEILTVLAGEAEVWIEDEKKMLTAGHSALVQAGRKHGFLNTGSTTLHVLATLASPIFEGAFDNGATPRRWSDRRDETSKT